MQIKLSLKPRLKADEITAALPRRKCASCATISPKNQKADEANYKERIQSSADLQKRRVVLEAKQEIITVYSFRKLMISWLPRKRLNISK